MAKYREIRTLKTEGRSRRPPLRRRSMEEPLLQELTDGLETDSRRVRSLADRESTSAAADEAIAAVDAEAAAAAAAAEAGESPPATLSGPFNRTRTGSSLWRVAKGRLADVRDLQSVPEGDAVTSPASVRRRSLEDPLGSADSRRQSIIEKMMFTLSRAPSFMSYGSATSMPEIGDGGEGGAGAAGAPVPTKFVPGAWAPRSDAHFLWHMIWGSYLNILLFAIPVGIAGGIVGASPSLVFWANFMALLPLALILGEITEDLAVRFGDTIGGLLNASFGNVVEMILGLAALSRGLYRVVAASLIGSILSNLLLVLGCCFLFGGFRHKTQRFNTLANKVSSSLLFLAAIAIIIPTSAKSVYGDEVMTRAALTNLSHAIALLLVGLYVCYLVFQLKTHADSMGGGHGSESEASLLASHVNRGGTLDASDLHLDTAAGAQNGGLADVEDDEDEEDEHTPRLSLSGALATLTVITIAVAVCSEYLTGAIEAVSKSSGINEAFLGLIVLPIAGNAAEHITAVFVAIKNKMDLAIAVALGSSIQIAIFVLPVTVLAGWAMGKELTLDFDPFAVIMMTVSIILSYFVSSDGSSNWLLGLQLVVTYVLIGAVYLLEKEGGGGEGPEGAAIGMAVNATTAAASLLAS